MQDSNAETKLIYYWEPATARPGATIPFLAFRRCGIRRDRDRWHQAGAALSRFVQAKFISPAPRDRWTAYSQAVADLWAELLPNPEIQRSPTHWLIAGYRTNGLEKRVAFLYVPLCFYVPFRNCDRIVIQNIAGFTSNTLSVLPIPQQITLDTEEKRRAICATLNSVFAAWASVRKCSDRLR